MQSKILEILQSNEEVTLQYLIDATQYSRKSISARISELRKKGYRIVYYRKPKSHYILFKEQRLEQKILSFISKRKLWGATVNYDNLAKGLKMNKEALIEGLVEV